jgi:hypothetical protein
MDHEYFMSKAVELSLENMREGKWGPFGAIIVKDWKIVGQWANHVTSENDPTAHAEIVAIRDACKNLGTFQLDGCIIYTSCEPVLCVYEQSIGQDQKLSILLIQEKMPPKYDLMMTSSTRNLKKNLTREL